MNKHVHPAFDLDGLCRDLMAANAEAAERYKAIAPPVAPEQMIPGSDDLDAEEAA